jgi:hypothetical protein
VLIGHCSYRLVRLNLLGHPDPSGSTVNLAALLSSEQVPATCNSKNAIYPQVVTGTDQGSAYRPLPSPLYFAVPLDSPASAVLDAWGSYVNLPCPWESSLKSLLNLLGSALETALESWDRS